MNEIVDKDKLRLFRSDYRKKYRQIWFLFKLSLIISIVSVYGIAYMNVNPWDSSIFWLVICTVGYTFGLGYVSGFVFYYLSEFLPKTRKLYGDIQKSLLLIDRIYSGARIFEEAILEKKKIESEHYAEYMANEISTINESGKCVLMNGVIKLVHMIALEIDFEEKSLYEMDNEVMPVETLKAIRCLNVYKALVCYNSVKGINDLTEVDRDDLLQALKLFKVGLDNVESYIIKMKKYTNYKYE